MRALIAVACGYLGANYLIEGKKGYFEFFMWAVLFAIPGVLLFSGMVYLIRKKL